MQTFKLPHILHCYWFNRRNVLIASTIILIPLMLIGIARLMSTQVPKSEILKVARAVLIDHADTHPLSMGWQFVEARISDQDTLEMVVNVASIEQARVILSRRGRIRYSYMKRACPAPDANVYKVLPKNQTVWVRLQYHDTFIVSGACPLTKSIYG